MTMSYKPMFNYSDAQEMSCESMSACFNSSLTSTLTFRFSLMKADRFLAESIKKTIVPSRISTRVVLMNEVMNCVLNHRERLCPYACAMSLLLFSV